MDTSAITRIENGSRDPRLSEAEAFASALGVPLSELISSDSTMAAVVKLFDEFDLASDDLVAAVYKYGLARRALLEGLDNDAVDYPTLAPFHEIREVARWGAIRDWSSIKADHDRRVKRNPPYDESVFDAEA